MNQLQVYQNDAFGSLEILMIDGKEHFPATKCARSLGYKEPQSAIRQHCRYCAKHTVPHPQSVSKTVRMNFIPEGDLHRLITHSRLPEAKKYERWVFDEVLPTIRKTGAYSAKPAPQPEQLKIEEPYEYKPKFWRGRQVVTLRDIEKLTGVREEAVAHAILRHRKEIRATDGRLLKGDELRVFKAEYGLCWRTSMLWVLTKRGIEKLALWMSRTEQPLALGVWTGAATMAKLPAPVEARLPDRAMNLKIPEWLDVPNSPEAQNAIAEIRKGVVALDVALDMYNTKHWAKGDSYQDHVRMLCATGAYIMALTGRIRDVTPSTIRSM